MLTSCPPCGTRQRIDRLTGLEVGLVDPEDGLLELQASVVSTDLGLKGRQRDWRPVNLTAEQRLQILRALAAQVLSLV